MAKVDAGSKVSVSGVDSWLSGGQWFLRVVRERAVIGRITGTAAQLAGSMGTQHWPTHSTFGRFLDRLQEAPEEVEGMDADTVAEAVEWLRANVDKSNG